MRPYREAIVLAGGFGTRLAHVVPDVCKPMAPVAGRPFLRFIMDQSIEYSIRMSQMIDEVNAGTREDADESEEA